MFLSVRKIAVTAQKFLSKADPVMKKLIKRFGSSTLEHDSIQSPFEALTRAVASQQLHEAASEAILRRFINLVPQKSFPEPDDIEKLTDDQIRSTGFSRSKILALRDLADKVKQGVVPSSDEITALDNDVIVSRITQVRGIGRWTVEIMLIFKLGRMDVLPVDDFAIRKGFMRAYGLAGMPKPKEIYTHGEKWRPYRTVASWYLWQAAHE